MKFLGFNVVGLFADEGWKAPITGCSCWKHEPLVEPCIIDHRVRRSSRKLRVAPAVHVPALSALLPEPAAFHRQRGHDRGRGLPAPGTRGEDRPRAASRALVAVGLMVSEWTTLPALLAGPLRRTQKPSVANVSGDDLGNHLDTVTVEVHVVSAKEVRFLDLIQGV